MMKIKGVIFDMDGVLINSEVLYQRFWFEALKFYKYFPKKEQILALRSLTGKKAEEKLHSFFGEDLDYIKVKEKRIQLMDDYVEEKGVEMKEGADVILKALKDRGIRIALATSSPFERAKNHLSKVNIFQYFDKCVCGPMVKKSKPHPDIYLKSAEELKLMPQECIAVEDSPNGALSAISAGCNTVFIPDLTPCPKEIEEKLFKKCTSLLEIIDLI